MGHILETWYIAPFIPKDIFTGWAEHKGTKVSKLLWNGDDGVGGRGEDGMS